MMEHITFISAGAGSGKTYRLAEIVEQLLTQGQPIAPAGVLGTTFTKLAASELRERVRLRLNERGHTQIANQMDQALLGTVNSVCGQLLSRFAFEAGLSPQLTVIDEVEAKRLFELALEQVLDDATVERMNDLAQRLSQDDWQKLIKDIVNVGRANNQTQADIEASGALSAEQVLAFYPPTTASELDQLLADAVSEAFKAVKQSILSEADKTKKTGDYLDLLQELAPGIQRKTLSWANWAKLAKAEPGQKIEQQRMP